MADIPSNVVGSIGQAQFELAVDDAAARQSLEKFLASVGLTAKQIADVFDQAAEMYGLSFKRGADAAVKAVKQANNEISADSESMFKMQVQAKAQELEATRKFAAAVEQEYARMTGTLTKDAQLQADAAIRAADAETRARNKAAADQVVAQKKARDDEEKAIQAALDKAVKADAAAAQKVADARAKALQLQVDAATKAADAETKARNKAAADQVVALKKARDDEEKATEAALDKALKADQAYAQKVTALKRSLVETIITNKQRQVAAEIKEEEKAAQAAGAGGGLFGIGQTQLTQGLVALTGIGGFYAAFRALHDVLAEVAKATQEAHEAQFELNQVYKDGADTVTKFAAEQAKLAGRPTSDVTKGVATLGSVKDEYGLTTEQIQSLTRATLDLAAAHGRPLQQSFEAVRNGLAGETDGLKQLGIVIKEDTIRNSSLLTEAEKKHYELVSESRKEQVRFAEIMRQSGEVTGAAASRAGDAAGAFGKLGASLKNAAAEAGGLVLSIGEGGTAQRGIAGLTQWIEDDIAAWEKWITIIGRVAETGGRIGFFGRDVQADIARADRAQKRSAIPPITGADADAAGITAPPSEAARAAAENARRAVLPGIATQADEAVAAAKQVSDAQLREINANKDAIDQNHEMTRQQIERTKDADIQASRDKERADLDSIKSRQEASKAYYEGAIASATAARDAALRAAQDTKDAAIRAVEDEVRARNEARRKEDQDLSDSQETQKRYAGDVHEQTMRGIEAETEAARRKTSDAIRGLDDQSRAEDERHRTAMRDIDDEEKRQLDAIDSKLRALDFAERMRSDKESIGNAQDRVRNARTWTEKRAAEQALEDAKHRIGVDKQREKLQDQARDVRKHFDEVKRAEQEHNESVKKGLDDQKEQTRAAGQVALDQIAARKLAETQAYEQTQRDMKDRFDAEKRAIDDRRVKEDADIATRRRTIEDAYTAEQRAIHATYDDPVTGLIGALHRSSEAANQEYEHQKTAVTARAEHERTEIDNTAKAAALANDNNTRDAKRQLEIQAGYWGDWRAEIEKQVDLVRDKISKGLIPDLDALYAAMRNAPASATTQNQYPQPGGGVTNQSRTDLFDNGLQKALGPGSLASRTTPTPPIIVIPHASQINLPLPGAEPGTTNLQPGVTGKDFADIMRGYGLPLPPLLEKPGTPHPAGPQPSLDLPVMAGGQGGAPVQYNQALAAAGDKTFIVNVDARGAQTPQQIADMVDQKMHQLLSELDSSHEQSPMPPARDLAMTTQ